MKRFVDIVIASIAILFLSPVFLFVAYKVRKHLGSPIFFCQERPGKNGKLFKMMKFRSMKDANDAHGNPFGSAGGKWTTGAGGGALGACRVSGSWGHDRAVRFRPRHRLRWRLRSASWA